MGSRRKKNVLILLLLMVGVLGLADRVTAQELETESVDLTTFDFSQTRVSFAGPSAFFFRNVGIQGQNVSLLFRKNAEGEWQLGQVFSQEDAVFPSDVILDFARLEALDDSRVAIDGILVDGKPYRAELSLGPDMILGVPDMLSTGSIIGTSLARVLNDAGFVPKDSYNEVRDQRDHALDDLQTAQNDRNRLSSQVTDLEGRVDELTGQASTAEQALADARMQIEQLEDENLSLEKELVQVRASLAEALAARSDDDPDAASDDGAAGAGNSIDEEQFRAQVAALEFQVDALKAEIQELRKTAADLREAAEEGQDLRAAGQELTREIASLRDQLRDMTQSRNDLENQLITRFGAEGYLGVVKGEFTQTLLRGFESGTPAMGTWNTATPSASRNGVVQSDPDQYFARYDFRLNQDNQALLYRLRGRSLDPDWVGYGLHLFTENSEARGYGFGEGLLVWLTRDPEVYGNNRTYLEVYRSRDDVDMERVLHAAIQEPISGYLDLEVLYEPEFDYITLSVNGEEKVRYKTWFGVNRGVQTSLRALGRAEFTDFEVLSR